MLPWKFRLCCLSLSVLLFCHTTARAERLRLPAALQAQVNEAVDRGIVFLFKTQGIWGTWTADAKKHPIGYAALPGLTLLECGEPKDHPVLRLAASFVRQRCTRLDSTYELALAILFLDRLGDPADEKLIQTLALRLIAGQASTGGWNYHCPVLNPLQSQHLLAALRGDLKKASASLASLRNLPVHREPSDNSNSQFATLALWVAQRHGLPMQRTLALIGLRFDTSQNFDGSWGYHYRYGGGEPERPSMTCVGLLGLAIGHGVAADQEMNAVPTFALDRTQVAAVAAFHPPLSFFLLALERVERKQVRERAKKRGHDPRILNGFLALSKHVGEPVGRIEAIPQHDLYFMWSLERVAVLYDLPTIGGKDWYRWGAEMLLANQKPFGNWQDGGYPGADPIIDTCLALLFLKRANLVTELTSKLPFDSNTLTASINQKLGVSPPGQSPIAAALLTAGLANAVAIAPNKAADLAAQRRNRRDTMAASLLQPSPPPEETERRGTRSWLWLLVVLAVMLFIACGVLLASYSLSQAKKRRGRRRYGKRRLAGPQRSVKYARR
jgi:hypothetical protein